MNLGCTREGVIFIILWQAFLWGVIGLCALLNLSTDLRNGAAILICVVGFSLAAVKTEWSLFGE